MSKAIKIFILLIVVALVFNKQLITYYYSYKFSKWIERQFVVDKFYIDYPNSIVVSGIKIKNRARLPQQGDSPDQVLRPIT